jgi:RNA polymerase sigma factor (sigma-70 family)
VTKGQQSFGRDIQALFDTGAMGELTDRQLLERFNARDKEGAELAFAVLVERHGPMVFHACRSILRDRHAAEDAFQATFLILSRKARSLWVRDSLGRWLFATACRVAWCARTAASRRRKHEQKAAELVTLTIDDGGRDDRDAVLYDELNRLPERYRVAVMLCDLDGLTQEQAARQLGWPPGTVRSRLARGRGRLRDQLTRRGLAPAIVPLGASLARPVVPASLAALTVETAMGLAAGGAVTGTLTSAIALTEGVTTMLFMSKLKLILAIVLTGGVMIGGTTLVGHRAMRRPQAAPRDAKTQAENQVRPQADPTEAVQRGPEHLSPLTRARIEVARKLRDNMFKLYSAGEADLGAYLSAQRRFDDVIGAVAAKSSDTDRVHSHEVRVEGLKHLERFVREAHGKGEKSQNEVLTVELDRLDAEEELAKAKAKIGAGGNAAKARLEVAKKIRDWAYLRFKGGLTGVEELLIWQKHYDDLANDVILMTGGDKVRQTADQVAELKRIEKLVEELFGKGQMQETDVQIVRYYRLGAEEALASAKADTGENPGKAMNKE